MGPACFPRTRPAILWVRRKGGCLWDARAAGTVCPRAVCRCSWWVVTKSEWARRETFLRALGEPRLVVAETQPAEAAALSAEADVAMMVFGGDEEEGLNYLQKESERTPRPVLFALLNEQSEALRSE